MAQNEINQYNESDETNTDITGTTVVQNQMYPYHVDDAFRKLMGALARLIGSASIVAAGTTNLGSLPGEKITVTGNTTITSFGTIKAGTVKFLNFTGTPTLTYNATSLILPTTANIVVAAGDTAVFVSEGSGNWRCVSYQRATGQSVRVASSGRNLWVNPDFSLSQENGNTLGTSSGFFPADQIALYFLASTAAMSVQRVQVRSLANSLNQIEFKTTTAKISLGANDFVTLTQPIEGSSFAEAGFGTANAKPYAFRFQFTGPAGTYHWHFANSAANRHCSVPFVVAGGEANTAVVKEIVVPADTGGTWLTADGVIGLTAELVLAAGATLTGGTASTWGGTFYLAASANFNTLGSTANVVRLGDVGLKKDEAAAGYGAWTAGTDAVYRGERYYQKSYPYSSLPAAITNSGIEALRAPAASFVVRCKFQSPMAKIVPSIVLYNPRVGSTGTWDDMSASAGLPASATYQSDTGFCVSISSATIGNQVGGHWTANARLT